MKALSVLTAALLAVSTSALAETKASVVLVHGRLPTAAVGIR